MRNKVLKGFLISSMAFILFVGTLIPSVGAQSYSTNNEISNSNVPKVENVSSNDMINIVEEYVVLNEDGTIAISKNMPDNLRSKYNIDQLQKHFDVLNKQVHNGDITINQDLTITENGLDTFGINKHETHWWGVKKWMNNAETNKLAGDLTSTSAGTALAGILGASFPPTAVIGAVSTAYFQNLSGRLTANNQGDGVIMEMTWALVFDITPQ